MAEIPVERKKGGFPWWLIPLLLLLLLIPLLLLFGRGCNDRAGVAVNANNGNANRSTAATTTTNANGSTANSTTVGTTTANANTTSGTANSAASGANTSTTGGATVTDVNMFGGTSDKLSLAGRSANLQNVRVERVLSDHVFTVKSGSGEMFVYLDESQDTGGGNEKAVKIKPGQELNLTGDFRRVPSAETENEKTEKKDGALTAKEYQQMKGQQVYLHARAS